MMIPRHFFASLTAICAGIFVGSALAEDTKVKEPVHRVANASASLEPTPIHSLDRALALARSGLTDCRSNVDDYTAILIKRERVDGVLSQHEYMSLKVRNRKIVNGKLVQPLSVYLHFLKPSSLQGREVIYVENENDGNIVAHEGGFKGKFLPTVALAPKGMLAMRGQRYPVTEIGVENLIVKLIERGEASKRFADVQCDFRRNARVKDSVCTVLEVLQPTKHPELEFYKAQVFIDDSLNIPIRYIAYDWPAEENAPLEVLEEYNYLNLKVNVGLTAEDFNPYNEKYNFYSK
ncbi:DUF1571 domain-containing protein [Rubripirellula sp.]|nr:DUF1571 domain-containing protein [Rubripirellula sp.]